MFRTKICGITNVSDAHAAVAAGADAIGLNFYPQSARCIDLETARLIVTALPEDTMAVGVFVNATPAAIDATCRAVGLGAIQLHGDEPPGFAAELPAKLLVIRSHRWDSRTLTPLADYLRDATSLGRRPDAVLIDACSSLAYGGTGETIDWQQLADERHVCQDWPLILAGGLTARNVGQAIRIVRPEAVDVASGVETTPGQKDHRLMTEFVREARQAFSASGCP